MITLSILSLKDFVCMLYIETGFFTQRINFFVKAEMTFFLFRSLMRFFLPEDEADEEHIENGGNSVHQSVDNNLQKSIFQKLQSNPILFAFQIPIWMLKTCTRRDFEILLQKCNKTQKFDFVTTTSIPSKEFENDCASKTQNFNMQFLR